MGEDDHTPHPPEDSTPEVKRPSEALGEALDTLENMLAGSTTESAHPTDQPAQAEFDLLEDRPIPVLNDVAIPGAELPVDTSEDEREAPDLPPLSADAACQAVFDRLTSEIEVIVESGVEEALRAASKDIIRNVRRHVDIVLPEILDEIAQIRAGKDSGIEEEPS